MSERERLIALAKAEGFWDGSATTETGKTIYYATANDIEAFAAALSPQGAAPDAQLLFDFGGFLTSSERQWVFSSHDDAAPMVDAIRAFAAKRGIDLDAPHASAPVQEAPTEPLITVESSLRFRLESAQQKIAHLEEENRELRGRLPSKDLSFMFDEPATVAADTLTDELPGMWEQSDIAGGETDCQPVAAPAPVPPMQGAEAIILKVLGTWRIGPAYDYEDVFAAVEAALAAPLHAVGGQRLTDEVCDDIAAAVRSVFGGMASTSDHAGWESMKLKARNLIRVAVAASGEQAASEADALAKLNEALGLADADATIAMLNAAVRIRRLSGELAADEARDYCPEKLKPGGCQLHNLHCGYPKCNAAPSQEKSAEGAMDGLRRALAALPRRQIESAPGIWTSWVPQSEMLDVLDEFRAPSSQEAKP